MHKWFRRQYDRQQLTQDLWINSFEQFSDCILLLDEHFTVMRYNFAWQKFIQNTCNDAQNLSIKIFRDFKNYIYPDDLYKTMQLLHPIEHMDEQQIRLINQQQLFWFNLRCQPVIVSAQGKSYYYFFLREQTEKIKQAALHSAQQRSVNGLLQRLPIMLYRSRNDRNWTMEYVNEGCLPVTGFANTQFINSPLYGQRIHPEDKDYVWSSVQQALDLKQAFELAYRWIDANERVIQIKEIGQGLYSSSDMILGVEGVIFKS